MRCLFASILIYSFLFSSLRATRWPDTGCGGFRFRGGPGVGPVIKALLTQQRGFGSAGPTEQSQLRRKLCERNHPATAAIPLRLSISYPPTPSPLCHPPPPPTAPPCPFSRVRRVKECWNTTGARRPTADDAMPLPRWPGLIALSSCRCDNERGHPITPVPWYCTRLFARGTAA